MKRFKPETDEVLSRRLSLLSLSLSSCFSSPIIVDFIKIDNGLLTLQLCLNAKQRISEKRAGDEFTHGDKGREIEKESRCFPFENITSTFGDFKMGTFLKEIEMRTAERLP